MSDSLRETPLEPLHREYDARMVPFAGYSMPVQFPTGIIAEHLFCRESAGLFDVSHMGQIRVSGTQAASALESLMPVDIRDLASGRQRYGFLTTVNGTLLDDLMIANINGDYLLIVNAACKDTDFAHLVTQIGAQCDVVALEDRALLALQGPRAVDVLASVNPDVAQLRFMDVALLKLGGVECMVSRSGYTGEDGFELSIPNHAALALARQLLSDTRVKPIGLGARDSLRLEAGLCLYGHDIDTTTTPVEAGLTWAVSKVRRPGGQRAGGYPGNSVIEQQLTQGAATRRVGLKPNGKAPIREGAPLALDGVNVGRVTSGGYGSTVGGPVAMGYVSSDLAIPGQTFDAVVRTKLRDCTVCDLPFTAHGYQR